MSDDPRAADDRGFKLRRLAGREVDLHKALRLRALRDSPDSFGESLEEAAGQDVAYWRELTAAVTAPGPQVMLLACDGDAVLGSAYGLIDRENAAAGRIGGMWVQPERRGEGVGRALLAALFAWAQDLASRSWGFGRRAGPGRPCPLPARGLPGDGPAAAPAR